MNLEASFKAISYTEEGVGKLIKMSKKKYTWEFKLNKKHCFLVLKVSKVTNNYSVELNSQQLYRGNKSYDDNFEFKFKIEGIVMCIKRVVAEYALFIQHIPFLNFYKRYGDRHTKLIKPDSSLYSEDFEKSSPEKRYKSLNTNAGPALFKEAVTNISTPVWGKNVGIKDAEELMEENRAMDELVKNKKVIEDIALRLKHMHLSESSDEGESIVINRMVASGDFGQQSKALGTKIDEVYHELDSEHESDDMSEASTMLENAETRESMEITLYPNDFASRDERVETVLKMMYN